MENKVHPAFWVQFHIDRFICGDWEGFYDRRCFNGKKYYLQRYLLLRQCYSKQATCPISAPSNVHVVLQYLGN